jgi:hypothetical protein
LFGSIPGLGQPSFVFDNKAEAASAGVMAGIFDTVQMTKVQKENRQAVRVKRKETRDKQQDTYDSSISSHHKFEF